MEALSVGLLLVTAIAVIVFAAIKLSKRTTPSQTTTAVLSPSRQENMTAENLNWKYSSMPWNNCLDANKVYCSQSLTRQPGGCMEMRSYPRCGASCNSGCPSACNTCVQGSCQ